jgi:hypothetical protein
MAIRKIIRFSFHQRGGNPRQDQFVDLILKIFQVEEIFLVAELPFNRKALNPWTRSIQQSQKKYRFS